MAVISMREMLEAGLHFGHQTRRWNPKMKRFIFGERNGIYIIDLDQTATRLDTAYAFVRDLVADGGDILFVGTKKQAQDPIQSYATKVGMPYVNERWLGGMLTNFETISKSVNKMLDLERMKLSGEFDVMIKKEALLLNRELTKLERNLGGLRDMKELPSAIFVVDTKKEHIAVTEANKLGIPVVAVVDTNVDPEVIQFPIPGNDDAIRANSLLCKVIADAVEEGRYIATRRPKQVADEPTPEAVKRSPEEEAAFAQAQAEARAAAVKAQKDREARLAASKDKATTADDLADTATSQGFAATPQEEHNLVPMSSAPDIASDEQATRKAQDDADAVAKPAQTAETPKSADDSAATATADADPSTAEASADASSDAPFGPGSHAPLPDGAEPDGFPIKGNADSMLYHLPGTPFYGRTTAEVWFATEDDAKRAGFQRPASQRDD